MMIRESIPAGAAMETEPSTNVQGSFWAALAYRDFRLLWGGLLVSGLGTWIQFTAMGYYICTIAGSAGAAALDLGILGAARAIPVLLATPVAGVLSDRVSRRTVMFAASLGMASFPAILGVLYQRHELTFTAIVIITTLNAVAQCFEAPARQSWVPLLVKPEHVGNALGLTSVAFNAPAVVGPLMAGGLIMKVGIGGSFFINGIFTLAVVVAIMLTKATPVVKSARESMFAEITQGAGFLFGDPVLKWIVMVAAIAGLFTLPYGMFLPAYAINGLHAAPQGLGLVIGASGIGFLAGGFVSARFGDGAGRGATWAASALVSSIGLITLGFIHSLLWCLPILALVGAATFTFLGLSNILLQSLSADEFRGRVASIYTTVVLGVVPAGSLLFGIIADAIGISMGFVLAGSIVSLFIVAVCALRPALLSSLAARPANSNVSNAGV